MAPAAASFPVLSLDLTGEAAFAQIEFATDSPLEGNGLELSVPREIGSAFEASSGLGRRRGALSARSSASTQQTNGGVAPPRGSRRPSSNEGVHAIVGGEASRN